VGKNILGGRSVRHLTIDQILKDLKAQGKAFSDIRFITNGMNTKFYTIEELARILAYYSPTDVYVSIDPVLVGDSWWATLTQADEWFEWSLSEIPEEESENWDLKVLAAENAFKWRIMTDKGL
jgi:hypothetical protein